MKYREFTKELAKTLECSQSTALYIADAVGELIIKAIKEDGKLTYPKLGLFKRVSFKGEINTKGVRKPYNATRVKLVNWKYLKGKL